MHTPNFAVCVAEWLQELEGMYQFNTKIATATKRCAARTANDDLARSLIREITNMGLTGFHELTEACDNFGKLQKSLSRSWITNAKKAKSKAVDRIGEANKMWESYASGDESEPSADGSSQGFSDSSASSLSAASSSLKRSVVFVLPGSSVTTHNLVLAPGLNGKTGIVREAQRCGRFAVEFSEPKCTVSLRAVNIAPAQ